MYNGLASRSLIGVEKYNIFLRKNLHENTMINNKRKESDSMKKNVKRYVSLAMAASLIFGSMNSSEFVKSAEKISLTKSVKVTVGKSSVLTLKNNKKKVTWKVVKGTKIVKITKKSKTGCTVIGLKKGTATVQATVEEKNYKCEITVVKAKENATKVLVYDGTNADEIRACKEPFSLVIKDGVTQIDNDTFGMCKVRNVTIPSSVNMIGEKAFYFCPNLESISVDKKNQVYDSRENCNAVVKKENNELIIGCKNTVIPVDITKIGNGAFYMCTNLEYIEIPQNIKEIGNEAFAGCKELKKVEIMSGVIKIGQSAFASCNGLKSIMIPESVTKIGSLAFEFCGLESITIPSGVTEIGYGTFQFCEDLKDIVIPSNLINIEKCAFKFCSNLTSITIPSGVKSISQESFENCDNLESITWNGTTYKSYEEFYKEFSNKEV